MSCRRCKKGLLSYVSLTLGKCCTLSVHGAESVLPITLDQAARSIERPLDRACGPDCTVQFTWPADLLPAAQLAS